MSSYTKENRGAIWKSDKKESDNHPDFTGNLNIDGVEYHVSAWRRKEDAKPRSPALTLSVKRKDEVHKEGMSQANEALNAPQQQYTPSQEQVAKDNIERAGGPPQRDIDDFSDDIPF